MPGQGDATVHPHVRGEYAPMVYSWPRDTGSSPRAWGIQSSVRAVPRDARFIPTCVGNTRRPTAWPCSSSVHPHVRGEYASVPSLILMAAGSSPRAWGILAQHVEAGLDGRFIPTCVGNTSASRWRFRQATVHPHVRGEYCLSLHGLGNEDGSSPRAWGIRGHRLRPRWRRRFIPTCVGNTERVHPCEEKQAVHPHVRGEYVGAGIADAKLLGSSPRAWGIHPMDMVSVWYPRFIPTCVGNTLAGGGVRKRGAVHPHVRGEYRGVPAAVTAGGGSSPRAWGIQVYPQYHYT